MKYNKIQKGFLFCGICSPLIYLVTDIIAGNLYRGYSFNEQAVSELFAIGAPTSHIVVPLFTISSILLLAFSLGIWLTAENNRNVRILAVMVMGNAINSLVLWNFFPMHMRGDQTTFTDTMHTLLAINPFILVSIIFGILLSKTWFRYYSIIALLLLFIPAVISFSNISLLLAQQPTPWLGFTERISIYDHQLWHAVLAVVLIHKCGSKINTSVSGIPSISNKGVQK